MDEAYLGRPGSGPADRSSAADLLLREEPDEEEEEDEEDDGDGEDDGDEEDEDGNEGYSE